MPATAEVALEILELPIEKLHPHPKNPRQKLTKDDPEIVNLRASIDTLGQKVPCLVRNYMGEYQTLLGHRRAFVQALRGSATVPCVVEDLDDDQAIAVMLADHATQVAPDPFKEAEVVAHLLARPGWSLQTVAQHLGKGVRWVALRSNLTKLSPELRKLWADGKKLGHWPIAWLEDLARLDPEAQAALGPDDLYELEDCQTKEDLDRILGERFHVLGKAPFKLDDATLYPKAGACTACPKTSLRAPGLFDDGDVDAADPKSLKKATCRDSACWAEKYAAGVKARVAELKAEHGKDTPVVKESYSVRPPAGVKALDPYTVPLCKKTDKGAKPAIVVSDEGVTVGWAQPRPVNPKVSAKKSEKPPSKDEDPKEALEASKKDVAQRRRAWILEELPGAIEKIEAAPLKVIQGFAGALGIGSPRVSHAEQGVKHRDLYSHFMALSPKEAFLEFWTRCREDLSESLPYGPAGDDFLMFLADELGVDMAALETRAIEAIPDPKWWPKADDCSSEKPTKKAKARA